MHSRVPGGGYTHRTLQVAASALHTGAGLLGYATAWEGEYLKKIVEGAYLIHLGSANAVLLDGGPELALVDAGFPDKASLVFDAIRQLGRLDAPRAILGT